ncbi:ATP-binding protein [Acidovorax sp. Root217]|uniref:AAA family ATPase n=1 Tax=Acidovorax sp. Root217 TaxID=1736492 RepID=UPI00138ECAA1
MSIRDETEVSLMGTALKDRDQDLIETKYSKHGVLPLLVLYGANASGKSNVLHALRMFRNMVASSFKMTGKTLPYDPFELDESSGEKPTKFAIDFIHNEVRYQYGFTYDATQIHQEWLYAFPKQAQQLWFHRDKNNKSIDYGRSLSGSNKSVENVTKKDVLFLSTAHASGHKQLDEIYNFVCDKIFFLSRKKPLSDIFEELHKDPNLKSRTEEFLRHADTGVVNIQTEERPNEPSETLTEFYGFMSKVIDAEMKPPATTFEGKLGHLAQSGGTKALKFETESSGTRELMILVPAIVKALSSGSIVILDEITTTLHTLLSRNIITLFADKKSNPRGAQLLFSTHDTNLLNDKVLRRDEIWFSEKSRDGASVVYPLVEIPTKNTDNIEKGYIQGRFGAIPYISEEYR